ncbi:MAG: hypothetical protein WBL74_10125 [Novosphingobium sp.]|uniref:hypothetical protein n=1 Tax=Novosphingobium sp. TaxID=1874826 RepID=UPI003C7B94CD
MSAADQRSNRIKERIAASQARLDRDSDDLRALPRRQPLPDAYPPEDYRSLAAEYPWLAMAAGLGIGMLAGALMPKGAGGKMGRRAMGAATVAAELGLAFSKQARDRAQETGREGLEQIGERTAPLRSRAARAGVDARSKGVRLAGEAIKLAARLRG